MEPRIKISSLFDTTPDSLSRDFIICVHTYSQYVAFVQMLSKAECHKEKTGFSAKRQLDVRLELVVMEVPFEVMS